MAHLLAVQGGHVILSILRFERRGANVCVGNSVGPITLCQPCSITLRRPAVTARAARGIGAGSIISIRSIELAPGPAGQATTDMALGLIKIKENAARGLAA
jgi:hypothetical protein